MILQPEKQAGQKNVMTGACVAQPVKRLPSAQVMISGIESRIGRLGGSDG